MARYDVSQITPALGKASQAAGLSLILLALVIELISHDPERRHCERGSSSWNL
jgi:hypothetical protein